MIRPNGSSKRFRLEDGGRAASPGPPPAMPTDPERSETVGGILASAAARLAAAGIDEPKAEAELLLAALLATDRGGLLVRRRDSLPPALAGRFAEWIGRRAAREPAQHLIGTQEFYGRPFRIDRRALVPRPETETLIDAVLGLPARGAAGVVDLGTGSGCIAITLAAERPDWSILALERSGAALELARENVALHGVERRVELVQGELTEPPAAWNGRIDLVVSNPPYCSAGEWESLQPEVRDHDPREALVAGPTGYEAYAALAPSARRLLVEGGRLGLEIGYGQEQELRRIVERAGFDSIEVRPDLRGIPRVLLARRR